MSYKSYEVRVYMDDEFYAGTREWRMNGKIHCEDGPAIERADGTKEWWLNNSLHREDGPALIGPNGEPYWYLNGKQFTEAEWQEATSSVKELTVKEVEELLGHRVKIVK